MITQAKLRELFSYDPITGIFTRTIDIGKRCKAGDKITNTNNQGYIRIIIDRKSYQAHRKEFALHVLFLSIFRYYFG